MTTGMETTKMAGLLRKVLIIWLALVLMAILFGDVSVAASDAGRTAADFLQIGQGAQAAGMGGAFTAMSSGAMATYWNPAGLSGLDHTEVAVGHFSWYQDITVEQASMARPLTDLAVIGASVTYVNYGDIEGFDNVGVSTGQISAYDFMGGLSIGFVLNDHLSAGVTAKIINQKLDEYSATAFAGDFGLRYHLNGVDLAASVTNLGSQIKFDQESEDLPSAARFGIAARPFGGGLITSFELEQGFKGDMIVRQGLEMGFTERYYIRTGYDYVPSQEGRSLATGLAFGAGVDLDFARFDYAFSPNDKSTSEDLHRFTLIFSMGN